MRADAVAPENLVKVIDQTSLARAIFGPLDLGSTGATPVATAPWEGDGLLAREPRHRAVLIVKLAAELYRRDHGRPPATAGALVGLHLTSLPEGIKSDDAIPSGIETSRAR